MMSSKPQLRYTNDWQEDRAVAAGGSGDRDRRGRKVRTPQGSVPDNVRDAGFKARGRPVPQKRNRLGYPSSLSPLEASRGHPWNRNTRVGPACRANPPLRKSSAGVRVKWCGKSAPLRR